MKILVVGSGGREHAIIKNLAKSDRQLFCAPGNSGIKNLAQCVDIQVDQIDEMVKFAKEENIDLCIIAPDDPLVMGMADAFLENGIRTFGPTKSAAIIEGSKAFSKQLMKKYNIPTADYEIFDNVNSAIEYLKNKNQYPIVIKASGLALGKGVIIANDFETAKETVNQMLIGKLFGESGKEIVIEEFLTGQEVSVLAFTDTKTIKILTSAQDHKRIGDGDTGANTGGMGVVAPNPYYTKQIHDMAMNQIYLPTIKAMNKENRPFKGVLFFGLMITQSGPKVIEYNCRLGDPEAQVCLTLLKTDLLDIIQSVIDEKLEEVEVELKDSSAACVMLVSGGYPENYKKGMIINGLDKNGQNENFDYIYHSATKLIDEQYSTNGGRVLGLVSIGETLDKALENVYNNISEINFDGCYYRKDIGGKCRGL